MRPAKGEGSTARNGGNDPTDAGTPPCPAGAIDESLLRFRFDDFPPMSRTPSAAPILAFAVLALAPPAATAQESESELWRSTVEFGFQGASGNTSFSILTASGALNRLQQDLFELELSGRVRWGRNGDEVIANDQRATLKGDWKPDADWSPFLYATARRDVIRNLARSIEGGGGVKWTFFRRESGTKASLSSAAIMDAERYILEPGSTAPERRSVTRLSTRLKLDFAFGSGATLQHVTFWQPRFSDFGDYLVDATTTLTSPLTSSLSLAVEHSYVHDALPPPGAVRDDQRLSVVLRVAL